MRRFGHHVRITHRFARDLRRGTFGELAADLFGLDNGAIIGLDYRFSPFGNVQVGVYRSMLFRTIQASARVDGWRQASGAPLSLSVVGSIEGANNMRDDHAPALGIVASRTLVPFVALYASPTFVWRSQTPGGAAVAHDHEHEPGTGLEHEHPEVEDVNTGYVGLGARVRVRPTAFVVLEFTPRVSGFAPGRGTWGVAIEKQTRGERPVRDQQQPVGGDPDPHADRQRGFERSALPVDAAVINALVANPAGHYFNIHTTLNPGGAVRGQMRAQ